MAKKGRGYNPEGETTERASWEDVDMGQILATIEAGAKKDAALRFGNSRDGGALALGVYGDGDKPYTLYSHSPTAMEEHLIKLERMFDSW